MTSWFVLVLAGVFEVVWALGTKMSDGYTKLTPSVITIISMFLSVYLLAVATRNVPFSVAYTVWVGMGVMGTFVGSIWLFSEKITPLSMLFLLMILVGIIGLKLSTHDV